MVRLAPGLGAYVLVAALLAIVFGWSSLTATMLPVSGGALYRSAGWGFGTHALGGYLAPPGLNFVRLLRYWAGGDGVPWWVASTIAITGFGVMAAVRIISHRRVEPRMVFIAACSAMHIVFLIFAYGAPQQHMVFDPILVAGVMGGIFFLPLNRWRNPLLIAFLGLSAFTDLGVLRHALLSWRDDVTRTPATAGLMANRQFSEEWRAILERSKQTRLFLLSYGSGPHHYFPTVRSPEPWIIAPGLNYVSEWDGVLREVQMADVVAVDSRSYDMVRNNAELRFLFSTKCAESETDNFIVFNGNKSAGICLSDVRHLKWHMRS
jgi:multisubunit Na+/H+ antiporter MnhF subunit